MSFFRGGKGRENCCAVEGKDLQARSADAVKLRQNPKDVNPQTHGAAKPRSISLISTKPLKSLWFQRFFFVSAKFLERLNDGRI